MNRLEQDEHERLCEQQNYFEYDTGALSLEGAYYISDGKTLDATLILHGKDGFEANNTLSYGMLIDSDSDFNTGIRGFEILSNCRRFSYSCQIRRLG